MSRRIFTAPQWFRRLRRITLAVAVLLAIPAVAAGFALSAYSASGNASSSGAAVSVSPLAAARTGVIACATPNVWAAAPAGRGIEVKLHGLTTPGPVRVTVFHDSDRTSTHTKVLASGQDSLQFGFRKIYSGTVDAVFLQTGPGGKCEVDSLGDLLEGSADR